MPNPRLRYVAECNSNRSQTWAIRDRITGDKVQDYIINRDEARWMAREWNVGATKENPDENAQR